MAPQTRADRRKPGPRTRPRAESASSPGTTSVLPGLGAPSRRTGEAPPEHRRSQAPLDPELRGDRPIPRWRRWYRPLRRLKLTREGKYFILITLGVGFAAINTGNNLLYLLLGMLLSLIVVSGVLSDLSLRHLTVTRRLPTRAQVGRPHLVEIEVFNHKRRIPSYAIEIEDLRAGQPADKRCFFLKISPRSAQVAAYRRTPARRGKDRHVGFRVATRFPFGLFEKSRELQAEGQLIIYPAVDPVRLPPHDRGTRYGGHNAVGRGIGDEIYGVRPMREGDDPRDIYWRKSTMDGQFILIERSREAKLEVELPLETTHSTPSDDTWLSEFERRIRDVASKAVAHLRRGDIVTLKTTAGERARADGSAGVDPLLRFLALLEPQRREQRSATEAGNPTRGAA